jgi:hypothetical protein
MTNRDDVTKSIAEQSLKRHPDGLCAPPKTKNPRAWRIKRFAGSKLAG